MLKVTKIKNAAKPAFNWMLVVLFVGGGLGNVFASPEVIADYARWNYPSWFHNLTGALELVTAVLLARGKSRQLGNLLGGGVITAAALTVLLHREYDHAIAPLVLLVLICFNTWLTMRARSVMQSA